MGAGSKDGLPAESADSSSNCGEEQEGEAPDHQQQGQLQRQATGARSTSFTRLADPPPFGALSDLAAGQAAHRLARPLDAVATPDTPVPIGKLPPPEAEANHRGLGANGGDAGPPSSSIAARAEVQQQQQQGPVVEQQQQQLVSRVVSSNKPPLSNVLGSKPSATSVQATGGQANCMMLHCLCIAGNLLYFSI